MIFFFSIFFVQFCHSAELDRGDFPRGVQIKPETKGRKIGARVWGVDPKPLYAKKKDCYTNQCHKVHVVIRF